MQVASFIQDEFGGVERCRAAVKTESGRAPSEEAVKKWSLRGNIPGAWLFEMLVGLEKERGRPISLLKYKDAG